MKKLLALSALALAVSVSSAQAQRQIGFAIHESTAPGGAEVCSAFLQSDPSANIIVTRDTSQPGEVWLIDLSQSGHVIPGASYPFGFTVATWVEPEHLGVLFNNLYIDDPQHMHLQSEWPTATGQNLGDYPGGFGNGVTYYAGNDVNGDEIFVGVSEDLPTPTATPTWGKIKSIYH